MKKYDILEEEEIRSKRFHLPFKHNVKCPKCGENCKIDLSMDYLSYPTLNKKESVYVYCEECDHSFEVDAILRISIEI